MAHARPDEPTSTLFLSGFPSNALDREMENFCRFLPGFFASRASVAKGSKVWVRFDSHANATAAIPFIDGQLFDVLEPGTILRAEFARTDLNPTPPERMQPRRSPMCSLGALEDLLGGDPDWAASLASPRQFEGPHGPRRGDSGPRMLTRDRGHMEAAPPHHGGQFGNGHGLSNGHGAPWSSPDYEAVGGPPWKRPRIGDKGEGKGENINDTLCIMRVIEKGYNAQSLEEFFMQVEGFVALRYAETRAGGSCFVKFESQGLATAALQVCANTGLEPEIARTSLNVRAPDRAGGGLPPLQQHPLPPLQQPPLPPGSRSKWVSPASTSEVAPGSLMNQASVAFAGAAAQAVGGNGDGRRPWEREGPGGIGSVAQGFGGHGQQQEERGRDVADTLCIMGLAEKGLSENALNDYFVQLGGFVALRYSGKGSGSCFVKFASPGDTEAAIHATRESGLSSQMARSSLNPRQATFTM